MRRGASHVEDPTIEQLAEEAAHTDDVAVRRTLFGWRELISTLIPLALIAIFARNVDWDEAGRALARSQAYYVVLALLVYYATFPLRSWRWSVLLRTSGARVSWRDLLRILFLGWFVNCIVPAKLGDLYRSFLVKQRFGVSLSRTVGVVVAERLLDLLVVFVLLIVGGYVAFGRTFLPDLRVVYLTGAALLVAILVALVAVYWVAPRLARFFPREVRRIGRLFREGVLHSFRALPVAGPLTVIIWSCEALRLFFVLTALGLDLPLSGVVFVAVATSLLTTVPLTPAGFGFVEIAMVYVLTEGFGLAQSDAIAVAVVDRAVSVLSLIVVGAIVYVRTPHEERVGRR
ncbi:MAG: flippase-like domain-containing protein [Chloroflexi bacterium]|nr:MAG: flippase-like domain-containing protein [Chloroflexota bacterium]TMC29394.1 MAG: flippase-like domain-containing protein [Chloroflexota bacterium]TMC34030.1 MAG: flippase-like domain-containing protein [Chloroflexota bacterium]TMC58771.1 MAG: flippase-like domain-containing protein [Chloroflexota bacterium]